MSTRFSIALLLCGLVSLVLFEVGATTVLSSLPTHASRLLPIVIIAGFILAPAFRWFIAPMLRAQYWRQEELTRVRLERAARSPV